MERLEFRGDRPIENRQDDRLGFAAPAAHVADAIRDLASEEGLVIGLEGEWGTGKSSFINLVAAALSAAKRPPTVIRFSPWLVSSRDALLVELFREIGAAAANLEPVEGNLRPSPISLSKGLEFIKRGRRKYHLTYGENLRMLLQGFGNQLSRIGNIALVAEASGLTGAAVVAGGAHAAHGALKSWISWPSLEAQKLTLTAELRKLPRNLIIFVDDIDRLEPTEAGEVVRLVRAVADFPNIVYVLSYSRGVLAKSLADAFRIPDGEDYLKKIVQVTFSVPRPEDFDLRRMFRQELEACFPFIFDQYNDVEGNLRNQRLARVIDTEGGRSLKSPRDVHKTINSLLLYARPILLRVEISDLVWLQLVRTRNSSLYDWVQAYVYNAAAVAHGAHVRQSGAKKSLAILTEILEKEGRDIDDSLYELTMVLPGIKRRVVTDDDSGAGWSLFEDLDRRTLSEFVSAKRLGSPQHFHYYFALAKPSGALDDEEFDLFILNAEADPDEATEFFRRSAELLRPQGGVMAEAILDRLAGLSAERIPAGAIRGISLSFANGLDQAALKTGQGDWGNYWIWIAADRIFADMFKRMPPDQRNATIIDMFTEGVAVGWLTNIVRRETFAHGRFGYEPKPEDQWIFTEEEFDEIAGIMQRRYASCSTEELLNVPDFLSLLFGWLQLNGGEEAKSWLASAVTSDDGFLTVLERMRSWAAVNDKVIHPLRRRSLEFVFDVAKLESRLHGLAGSDDGKTKGRAEKLLEALRLDEEYN